MKPEIIKKNRTANKVWNYYQKKLADAGRWEDRYAAAFTVLVIAIVDYLDVTKQFQDAGSKAVLVSLKGNTYQNPLLNAQAHYINIIKTFGAAFGLHPLAEARLKAVPNAAAAMGDLFQFLQGPADTSAAS